MPRSIIATPELQCYFDNRYEPIPESGCWIWMHNVSNRGYGKITFDGRDYRAHRVSYAIYFGDPGELLVCHKCDTPECVNPNHLFLGNHQDNMDDRQNKRRHSHGVSRWCAVLDDEKVLDIRKAYGSGTSLSYLAEKYNVSASTLWSAAKRKTWKHVK